MSQPIINASDRTLDQNVGTLPNVQDAMSNWFQPMTFTIISTSVENFDAVQTGVEYVMQGVKQPFTPQQLLMKPVGQRKWKWFTIHAFPGVTLDVDDQIILAGHDYRIMSKDDYSEYGYIKYDAVEDYSAS